MHSFSHNMLRDYEAKADLTMALICRIMMLFFGVIILLNAVGVFVIQSVIYPALICSAMIMFTPTILYNFLHLNTIGVRYFVLTLIVLMSGVLYSILSYHVIAMLVFPVVISCLYSDTKSVIFTSVLGIPVIITAHFVAFALRIVPDEPLVSIKGVVLFGIIPRLIEYAGFVVICCFTAAKIQELIRGLVQKNNELYNEQESIITSLAELIEAQSHETGQHVKRVSEYTKILCEALEMSDEEVWKVSTAAALHDAGKMIIDQNILNKPGKLTAEEFDVVKQHVSYGKKLLEKNTGELMRIAANIAYHHHEKYDGTGYMSVKGEDIDRYARCVSVADVFDALVSRRPYKDAWPPEEAYTEIVSQRGKQFDPAVVDVFKNNFDKFLQVLSKYPDNEQ